MFLKTLILEDFQAHEKSIFNFDKGLNILTGISNSGKSSVSRALQFILMGSPWDKSWVRFGAKYCKITLETDTGIKVLRIKGDKVNKYTLMLPNQQPQDFESFGTTVPEAIQQALKIHEVQIDTTDKLNLNLAGQMDSLFLLSQTGSYRAKVLGKLSGANYLDFAIRELNKDKRQVTAEKNMKDLEIVELQTQIDKLAAVEAYSSIIVDLEAKLLSLTLAERRVECIRELFRHVSVLKQAWIAETEKQALLANFDPSSISQLTQRVDKIKTISSLSSRIVYNNLSQTKIFKLQELLTPIDLSVILGLTEKISTLKKIKDLSIRFRKNTNDLVSKADELQQTEQKYNETKEQYSVMLKDAGICPICGTSTLEMEICK